MMYICMYLNIYIYIHVPCMLPAKIGRYFWVHKISLQKYICGFRPSSILKTKKNGIV